MVVGTSFLDFLLKGIGVVEHHSTATIINVYILSHLLFTFFVSPYISLQASVVGLITCVHDGAIIFVIYGTSLC